MSQQTPNKASLEHKDGQTFAVLRICLDKVTMPEFDTVRHKMDEAARACLTEAFPEDWKTEANRLETLYRATKESIAEAEKQIRALQEERGNLFAGANTAGADFDRIDEMEAKAELRKTLAVKRLAQFKEMVEAHSKKLSVTLTNCPANSRLLRGDFLEPDEAIQTVLGKVAVAIKPVLDNIAHQEVSKSCYQNRKASYNSLASELALEWSGKVMA